MSNDDGANKRRLISGLIVIAILAIMYFFNININTFKNTDVPNQQEQVQTSAEKLTFTMIDVGQGDSFLLSQNGKNALIDCGTKATGKDVVAYLKSNGITKLDYVFGTHPHDDHMGGMYEVITSLDVDTIVIPENTETITTNWYITLMSEIHSGKYNVEYAKAGKTYKLSDTTINIIGPLSDPQKKLNNFSTIIKVSFGEMDVLMTGDAEKIVEKELLEANVNLDSEILKVSHHGSDTSTSDEFLNSVDPDYALISAKLGNSYNHPSKSTMQKLKAKDIKVYRTDENGTVVITITKDSILFSSSAGDYLSGSELKERNDK